MGFISPKLIDNQLISDILIDLLKFGLLSTFKKNADMEWCHALVKAYNTTQNAIGKVSHTCLYMHSRIQSLNESQIVSTGILKHGQLEMDSCRSQCYRHR